MQSDGQRRVIRFPNISSMTSDRAPDETGTFVKSDIDALKLHKALSGVRPFSHRSREEVMEFVCYMFEVQGVPGDQICRFSERNRKFYFVASGELLHRSTGGSQQRRGAGSEQKLLELDHWGLESLFVGKDDRVSVTVTAPCRLFVLTAGRFFWLCKMAARRTLELQRMLIGRLAASLPSVQRFLEIGTGGVNDRKTLLAKANPRLLDRLMHSVRQVEVPPSTSRDLKQIRISCSSGQSVLVFGLTGCATLQLEQFYNCTDPDQLTSKSCVVLKAGDYHELPPNQRWTLSQAPDIQTQQTIVYIIKLKQQMSRASLSDAD